MRSRSITQAHPQPRRQCTKARAAPAIGSPWRRCSYIPSPAVSCNGLNPRPDPVEQIEVERHQPDLADPAVLDIDAVDADGLPSDVLAAEAGGALDELHDGTAFGQHLAGVHSHRRVGEAAALVEVGDHFGLRHDDRQRSDSCRAHARRSPRPAARRPVRSCRPRTSRPGDGAALRPARPESRAGSYRPSLGSTEPASRSQAMTSPALSCGGKTG